MDLAEKLKITRISGRKKEEIEDTITIEISLTIFLNGRRLKRLWCSPAKIRELVLGFLYSQKGVKDLKSFKWDKKKGIVKVEIPSHHLEELELLEASSNLKVRKEAIFTLASEMEKRSRLFRATGGVHNACLTDGEKIIFFSEDIGRQNALDKIIGESFLKNITLQNKIMLTSGRITSETITKIVRARIPVIISPGAPSNLAVNLARRLGVTIVGFTRGERMNIYSHPERII